MTTLRGGAPHALARAGRRWLPALLGIVALLSAAGPERSQPAAPAPAAEAYFQFDYPPAPATFTIKLTDPARIQQARDMLSGRQPPRHVLGAVVKAPAAYNPPWSYHLDPDSIVFFSAAVEVCDAAIEYVEEHLAEVGGAFLPGSTWCPWGSRLLRELQPAATPTASPSPTPSPSATPAPSPSATPAPSATPPTAPARLHLPTVAR